MFITSTVPIGVSIRPSSNCSGTEIAIISHMKLQISFLLNPITLLTLLSSQIALTSNVIYLCKKNGCTISNEIKIEDFDVESAQILKKFAEEPISSLLNKKILFIGSINLDELLKNISTVQFKHIYKGYISPQGRMTGVKYIVEDRSVYLTSEAISNFKTFPSQTIQLILLHESLGASGYFDEDYQLSALIMALNNLKVTTLNKTAIQLQLVHFNTTRRSKSPHGPLSPNDGNQLPILIAGGSTTIGGGGDPLTALIKKQLLEHIINNNESIETLILILNKIRIERTYSITDLIEKKLEAISTYPLTYESFLKSVNAEKTGDKTIITLGIQDFFNIPLKGIEIHLLKFLKDRIYEKE